MMSLAQPVTLARGVLSGRIGQKTNWVVLTGPPSSGKTAVLNALAALGYRTSADVSRAYLESRVKDGQGKYEARKDAQALQEALLWNMLIAEGALPTGETVFLEYALPDNLAFWELERVELTTDVWRAAVRFRYRHVFLFDALPLEEDHIRIEDAAYQQGLTTKLGSVYEALGYHFTVVPAAELEERISLILSRLAALPMTS